MALSICARVVLIISAIIAVIVLSYVILYNFLCKLFLNHNHKQAGMCMKRFRVVLFVCAALFLSAGSFLSAQDRSEVGLYFAPTTGGSQQDREFFDAHIPQEISGPGQRVVDSPGVADFLVSLSIVRNEDPADSSTLTLSLSAASAASESPLLELLWNYLEVEEMYTWNIGAMLSSGMAGDSEDSDKTDGTDGTDGTDNRQRRIPWLYVGLRGGGSFAGRYFQAMPGYYSGYSAGLGAELGLTVELRLLRFLSLQAEGDFVYEAFDGPGADGTGDARPADSYRSMSLIFPLLAKAPLNFGGFTLSLYAGAYYILALGDAEKETGATGETESAAVKMDLPLGFTVGTDLGFVLGPGELFADLRYGRDLGATAMGEGGSPHIRDRINVCVGYKFGF
jgi:hypothetical protein